MYSAPTNHTPYTLSTYQSHLIHTQHVPRCWVYATFILNIYSCVLHIYYCIYPFVLHIYSIYRVRWVLPRWELSINSTMYTHHSVADPLCWAQFVLSAYLARMHPPTHSLTHAHTHTPTHLPTHPPTHVYTHTHTNLQASGTIEGFVCAWVMSHMWISHITHMNESNHTYE